MLPELKNGSVFCSLGFLWEPRMEGSDFGAQAVFVFFN